MILANLVAVNTLVVELYEFLFVTLQDHVLKA